MSKATSAISRRGDIFPLSIRLGVRAPTNDRDFDELALQRHLLLRVGRGASHGSTDGSHFSAASAAAEEGIATV